MNKTIIMTKRQDIMKLVLELAMEYSDHMQLVIRGDKSDYVWGRSAKYIELNDIIEAEIENTCDHELVMIDDSFSHAFGIQEDHHFECSKCGEQL